MAVNMDDEDKNFLIKLFDTLKDDIKEIRNHQKKTCDELDTVDRNVTKVGDNLKAHLDTERERENDKVQLQKSKREKTALTVSIISVLTAVISVAFVIFSTL